MDWWAGINSSASSLSSSGNSIADQMNQVDANGLVFDPWLSCEDLDLGSLLNQATSQATTSNTITITNNLTNTTASSSVSSNHLSPPIDQSMTGPITNKCNGQMNSPQAAVFNYQSNSYSISSKDNNNNNNNGNANLTANQHQPQGNSPTAISPPSSSSASSPSSSPNKQNIFDFITCNGTNASAENRSRERQPIILSNRSNPNQLSVINTTNSLASSTTSPLSSSSTCELSPMSTNHSSMGHNSSSSPCSSSTSSLLIDSTIAGCRDVKPVLHTTHTNQRSDPRYSSYCNSNSSGATSKPFQENNDHNQYNADHSHLQQQQHSSADMDKNLENLICADTELSLEHEQPTQSTISDVKSDIAEQQIYRYQQQQPQPQPQQEHQHQHQHQHQHHQHQHHQQHLLPQISPNLNKSHQAAHKTRPNDNGGAPKMRRCRHITDFVLADEEKRLLIKEGYGDFPMSCHARPLTKAEERILRKIRRKIRNKKSAQCSRQRKKEYVEDLERKYAAIVRENDELKHIINKIQRQQQGPSRGSSFNSPQISTNLSPGQVMESPEFDWKELFPGSTKSVHHQHVHEQHTLSHQHHHHSNIYS